MIKDVFAVWSNQSDLVKLQYAYGVVIVVTLVVAGLVGLLDQPASWQILNITWIATVAFTVNLLSFAVINLMLPSQVPKVLRTPPKRKR